MSLRNRFTLSDYAVMAICPALIILLLSSLVSFLILCAYQGSYTGRVIYIWFMFILGAVYIARLSIEESRQYAFGYAAILGIATFFVLSRFQSVSGTAANFAPFITAGLIAIVWFLADRITYDCTLIDDDEDASGQGLLDGLAEQLNEQLNPSGPLGDVPTDAAAASASRRKRGKPQPGRTVLWLSAAALPLFGLGQATLHSNPAALSSATRYLAIYLFASFSLLVATSFLGVRRYLRQRGVQMPSDVTRAWLGGGLALVAFILAVCFLLPQPGRMIAEVDLDRWLKSPEGLGASRRGWGSEAAEKNESNAAPSTTDPQSQQASQQGGQQGSQQGGQQGSQQGGQQASQQGGQQASQQASQQGSQQGGQQASQQGGQQGTQPGAQQASQQGGQQGSQPNPQQGSPPNPQSAAQPQPGSQQPATTNNPQSQQQPSPPTNQPQNSPPNPQSNQQPPVQQSSQPNSQPSGQQPTPGTPQPNQTNPNNAPPQNNPSQNDPAQPSDPAQQPAEQNASQPPDNAQSPPSESDQPNTSESPPSQPSTPPSLPRLPAISSLVKALIYLVLLGIILFFIWVNRDAIAELCRKLLTLLYGNRATTTPLADDLDTNPDAPPRAFSSFSNPLNNNLEPTRAIVETLHATEAWFREHGQPRNRHETHQEFAQRIKISSTDRELVARLVAAYHRTAYGNKPPRRQDIEDVRLVWQQLFR